MPLFKFKKIIALTIAALLAMVLVSLAFPAISQMIGGFFSYLSAQADRPGLIEVISIAGFLLSILLLLFSLILLSYKKNISIPVVSAFLTRSYFKTKFRLTELNNDTNSILPSISRKAKFLFFGAYLKAIYHFILLFKNTADSFQETREELQNEYGHKIVVVDMNEGKSFSINAMREKVSQNERIEPKFIETLYENLYNLHQQKQEKTTKFSLFSLFFLIVATVAITTVISFLLPNIRRAYAATFNFTQNSWMGGYTGNTAGHTAQIINGTPWTEFGTSTPGIIATTSISLATSSYAFTDDGATSTAPASATQGGGFLSAGTVNASTTVSGSGVGASVGLAIDSGDGTSGVANMPATGACTGTGISGTAPNCSIVGATYNYTTFDIATGTTVTVTGTTALIIKASVNINIAGTMNLNGLLSAGGAGGYNGGSFCLYGTNNGAGAGGGGMGNGAGAGGRGGGFGGTGGAGGIADNGGGGTYTTEVGGSGGGRGSNYYGGNCNDGGGGGGYVKIISKGAITNTGIISANGATSATVAGGAGGGGGGGAGGRIYLISLSSITNTGTTSANGATGSNGALESPDYDGAGGGGGGGGRINLLSPTITNTGTTTASLGSGGTGMNGKPNGSAGAAGVVTSNASYPAPPAVSYLSSGAFTSATIDLGGEADFDTLSFHATTTNAQTSCVQSTGAGCAMKIQIAGKTTDSGWADSDYKGPDGTASTYFTDPLLGRWHLNETSGSAGDSYGPYTLTNTSVTYSSATKLLGANSAYFDAGADKLTSGSLSGLSNFTIEGWVKFATADQSTGNGYVFAVPTLDPAVVRDINEKIVVYRDGTTGVTSTATLNDTNWHYIAITADGTNLKLYIDGNYDNGVAWTGSSTAAAFNLGDDGTATTDYFTGYLDEFSLYNGALSAVEISARYNSGAGSESMVWTAALAGAGINGNRYVRYRAQLATTNTAYTPTLNNLTIGYNQYVTSGDLISSKYDSEDQTNVITGISWSASGTSTDETVRFQIRSSSTAAGLDAAPWCGEADCSGSTYFTASGQSNASSSAATGDHRWFQYRAFLTSGGAATPILTSVTVQYVVNASPEFAAVFTNGIAVTQISSSTDPNWGKVRIEYSIKDIDTDAGAYTAGQVSPRFYYSTNGGGSWSAAIATGTLSFADTSPATTTYSPTYGYLNTVATGTYTNYVVYWSASNTDDTIYSTTTMIKIIIDDNELANSEALATSSVFTLDSKNPVPGAIPLWITATADPVTLNLDATDNSALEMRLATLPDMSDGGWQEYNPSTTTGLTTDPLTYYVQFRDSYGNTTATTTVTTPETPVSVMIQDTSNAAIPEYRLFLAWKRASSTQPSGEFHHYTVFRSSDNIDFAELASTTDPAVNYYSDIVSSSTATYYYKVTVTDEDGNVSYYSQTLDGIANGTQDGGEGGGGQSTVPPEISNVVVTATTTQTATIEWDTDLISNSTVGYAISPASFSDEEGVSTMADSIDGPDGPGGANGLGRHRVTITGLAASTTYYFQVMSKGTNDVTGYDTNGGQGYELTTKPGPVIAYPPGPLTTERHNNDVTIVWQTDLPSDSAVVYSPNVDFSSPVTAILVPNDLTLNHSVMVSGLTMDTTYYYYVTSADSEGNVATGMDTSTGIEEYFNFRTTMDTTPPDITFSTSTDITNLGTSTVTIAWTTNKAATSTIAYGLAPNAYIYQETNANFNFNHTFTLTGLSSSTDYYFQLMSTDENNNPRIDNNSSVGYLFTTLARPDETAPDIFLVATSTGLNSAVISWSTDEPASSFIQYAQATSTFDTAYVEKGRSEATTTHEVVLDNLSEDQAYYFRVKSADANNNIGLDDNGGEYYAFTTQRDNTPPDITNVFVDPANKTDTTAVITWDTNESATGQAFYGTASDSYATSTSLDAALNLSHALALANLAPQTTYYYRVVSVDFSGNTATSTENSFTTLEKTVSEEEAKQREAAAAQAGKASVSGGGTLIIDKTDKVAPVITAIKEEDIQSDRATISWVTDEEANSFVEYGLENIFNENFGKAELTRSHSAILKNLLPETKYNYKVKSADASGNLAISENRSFTTLSLIAELEKENNSGDDENMLMAAVTKTIELMNRFASQVSISAVQTALLAQYKSIEELANLIPAPIMSGEPRVTVTAVTATIDWHTDKEANSLVAIVPDKDYKAANPDTYIQVVGNSYENAKNHSVTIHSLSPDTTYHYQLRSKALVGPMAKSNDFTFTTKKEQLEITDYIVNSLSPDSAAFKWNTNAETDSAVEYIPYRNNLLSVEEKKTKEDKTFTSMHEIAVSDLMPGLVYQIKLLGKDTKGDTVEKLIPTYSTGLDIVAPEIDQVQTSQALSQGKEVKVQTVISWVTNEPSTSRVYYQKGFAATSSDLQEKSALDNNYTKKHGIVITKFEPGAIYTFRVESTDSSGNTAISRLYTVLTPKQKESVFQVIMKNFESMFGWVNNIN